MDIFTVFLGLGGSIGGKRAFNGILPFFNYDKGDTFASKNEGTLHYQSTTSKVHNDDEQSEIMYKQDKIRDYVYDYTKEKMNEIAGTAVRCEKCNHSWDIEEDDTEKYLCHSCGWDSQQQEYDYAAFDSWQEKMGLNEELDEKSKGKLRPADLLRRKAAMAGKRAAIARKRKRTMTRRKPLSKLKKIAYKKAYLQVYDEFMKDLFPGMKKKDLSIQQAKIVHKNVLRKKKRVQKRARFKFLPALRAKEADKFDGKESLGYPSKEDMKKINQRLDNQRKNTDSNKEYQYHTIKENINESKLLMEGGAYGHMNHPFDSDVNLTFGQLKDIVNRALDGTLENTREKTDGQALAISWRDNRLVAARNKGHLKNKGENALDIKGVSDKFQGRGGLSDAYNFAMRDLSKAISSLSEKQRCYRFKDRRQKYSTSISVSSYL
jgi:hypothetical protein